jgi:hypothetical protein
MTGTHIIPSFDFCVTTKRGDQLTENFVIFEDSIPFWGILRSLKLKTWREEKTYEMGLDDFGIKATNTKILLKMRFYYSDIDSVRDHAFRVSAVLTFADVF